MAEFHLATALFLLVTIVVGLLRLVRGPTTVDRLLAVQLFGSTGIAVLLLLAEASDLGAARDVALIFALLTALATIAFVRRTWERAGTGAEGRKS